MPRASSVMCAPPDFSRSAATCATRRFHERRGARMIFHTAPWVLPISQPPLEEGVVALDERGIIRGVGHRSDLRGQGQIVEHSGVLLPGLVNAHAHVELSHLGLIPGGDGLAPWI